LTPDLNSFVLYVVISSYPDTSQKRNMIPRRLEPVQSSDWREVMRSAVTSPRELLRLLELPTDSFALAGPETVEFPMRVPRGFIARMRKGDPGDPLLRQVLPLAVEETSTLGYCEDPLAERAAERVPGLLHKYHGRVLLVVTGACAIHCRYCFRRHFPYAASNPARDQWRAALDYIRADVSISEVILSGGDPLSLPDERLADLIARLAEIPHVRRLRLHTRLPVVIPERITEGLLQALIRTRLRAVMVLHVNHPQELDIATGLAVERLRLAGIPLLNQAVLLCGVNDSAQSLVALSETIFAYGILPYYLHLLDPVAGTAHFTVPEERALELMREVRRLLPGYLVPRLVREVAGAPYKLPLL
jgi:EF-P beta-lysylation protein EpmB